MERYIRKWYAAWVEMKCYRDVSHDFRTVFLVTRGTFISCLPLVSRGQHASRVKIVSCAPRSSHAMIFSCGTCSRINIRPKPDSKIDIKLQVTTQLFSEVLIPNVPFRNKKLYHRLPWALNSPHQRRSSIDRLRVHFCAVFKQKLNKVLLTWVASVM